MRAALRCVGSLAVVALCGAGAASAQRPQTREGFWIAFGFGYGSAKPSCDLCGSLDSRGGATGFLKLGGTLTKQVLLGGEINAWTKSENGVTDQLGNVSAALYYYPAVASGFFLKGGVGFSSFRETDGFTDDGTGFGLLGGVGYDIRVGRNVSLTPVANFYWGGVGDIKESGTTVATGWKQHVFDVGLGVTFH